MATIVPRWEWRTFGAHFGIADTRFAELTPGASRRAMNCISRRRRCERESSRRAHGHQGSPRGDAEGLERWEPVMKQAFPLPAADAAKVFASLGLAPPQLARDDYTLDQFIGEARRAEWGVASRQGPQAPGPLHRRRLHCGAQRSPGGGEGHPHDRDRSRRTRPPSSRPSARSASADTSTRIIARGLRALLDDAPERYAVIDVGTNSVKLHVGEREAAGAWRTIVDRAEMTRLGEGLEKNGEIMPEAAERTASAIADMSRRGEAQRRAGDRRRRHGRPADRPQQRGGPRRDPSSNGNFDRGDSGRGGGPVSLPGREGGTAACQQGALVVFDTGGGSSQFTFGQGSQVDERFSVEVGAVRYTERFGLAGMVAPDVLRSALAADRRRSVADRWPPEPDALVAMGGAVTNIAAVKHGLSSVRPGSRAGHGARPGRDRPSDRDVSVARRGGAPFDRRPAAQARRCHPGWRVHRQDGDGKAWPGVADRSATAASVTASWSSGSASDCNSRHGDSECGVSQLPITFVARSHRQLQDISHTRILFLLVSLISPNCRARAAR